MRIIAGLAGGIRLKTPKTSWIRPASDKVKEALFNILGPVDGFCVLDLFAGTGSVGLEAVSRGALSVILVDSSTEAIRLMRENISRCRMNEAAKVIRGSIPVILSKFKKYRSPFHIIFIDPPYDKGLILPTLSAIYRNKLVDAQSQIIIEHSPREMPKCDGFTVSDTRKYGQTLVTFLKCLSA